MQVDVAEHGTLGKQLSISYSPDEVRARRDQVLRELSGKVRLPGFRPGRSTAAVVEKRFGGEASARAEEQLANEGLSKVITERGLKPIGPMNSPEPSREAGLRLVFNFEVRPSFTLPDLTSLSIPREELAIPDSEVEATTAVVRHVMATAAEPALSLDVPLDVEVGSGAHWGAAH